MLAQLYVHRLVSNTASERILGYLRMNQLRDLVAWPLPSSAALAGKTGGMSGSLLDAELVTVSGGPTYSLCVFASGFERGAQAKRVMAEVSEMIYSAVSGSRRSDCTSTPEAMSSNDRHSCARGTLPFVVCEEE